MTFAIEDPMNKYYSTIFLQFYRMNFSIGTNLDENNKKSLRVKN